MGDNIYSFCEPVTASGHGSWHIRRLTKVGKKLGGGVDTSSLCGHVKEGWDLEVEITPHHLSHSCPKCVTMYYHLRAWELRVGLRKTVREAEKNMEYEVKEIEKDLSSIIKEAKIIDSGHILKISSRDSGIYWNCILSPTGSCIYDVTADPAMDSCIYCGEPYERK